MATLLLELDGPMQSWGCRGRFSEKDTGREPTKSGVIGLVAAALGRSRDEDVSDLAELHFGLRVDREGNLKKEFQTAQNIIRADGGVDKTQLSNHYYLSGARFIAGFQGNKDFLFKLKSALLHPVYMPFLGRRSFVPACPVINTKTDSLVDIDLRDALLTYPFWAHKNKSETEIARLRLVRDALPGEEEATQDFRQDIPISFQRKEYLVRKVITEWIDVPIRKE